MTNKEFFIFNWDRENKVVAKGFRSLPSDPAKLKGSHHPKFRSPWELVNHIGPHAKELCQAVAHGRMDLVNEGKFDLNAPHIYKTTEEAAAAVEEYSSRLMDLLTSCSEEDWTTKKVPVFWGASQIMESTLMQLCWMMLFDTIHHMGQLTSYYRVLGTIQPHLMGPTAEEEEAMMASAG